MDAQKVRVIREDFDKFLALLHRKHDPIEYDCYFRLGDACVRFNTHGFQAPERDAESKHFAGHAG
jgi:hypothetical protein